MKLITTLAAVCLSVSALAQVQLGKNVQIGSGGAGANAIIPGTNVTCSPNVGGNCVGAVTINSTGGGGGSPAGNPLDVQTNLNGTSFGSDPGNFTYTAGSTHRLSLINQSMTGSLQIAGTGSQTIGVTNPSAGFAITANNRYTTKLNSPVDFARATYFGGPGGINYGNGPGASTLWTTSGFNFWNVVFARRGITQQIAVNASKRGTGDFAGLYFNSIVGVGGVTGASDEGGVGIKIGGPGGGGEVTDFYSGQATAGAATGSTTLPITAGVQTCDGCFLYDSSKPGPSGHFTGAPTQVTIGTASYFSEPIDTPVTPSTAFGVPVCNLPQLTDQTVPQTVACTVTGALGSTGVFVNGIASLSGRFAEQVSITVSAPSGGSQTVNITYRNPHLSGTSILWQGGTAQGMLQVLPFTTSVAGMPYGETVFGSPDSTHLAAGVAQGSGEISPDTNFSAPITFGAVTKSGSTASAVMLIPAQPAASYVPFANLATAVISGTTGCTGGSMDGTATSVTVNFLTNLISWTDASSSTGCTGGNIGFPASKSAYQLFPYAEQIASGDVSTSVTLEPNIVPFASGDNLVEPHPPTFDYNTIWSDTHISNPNGHVLSNGLIQSYGGAGIGGSFNPIRLTNSNPCNMYQGCGGSIGFNPWMQLEGPNWGTIDSTMPINPTKFAFNFACPVGYNSSPGAPGICNDVQNVLSIPFGKITADGTRGWNFSGTPGITANQINFSGGVGSFINQTRISGIQQAILGTVANGAAREAVSIVQNFLGPGCPNSTGMAVHIGGDGARIGSIGYAQDFGSPTFTWMCFALDTSGIFPLTIQSNGFSGGPYTSTFTGAVAVNGAETVSGTVTAAAFQGTGANPKIGTGTASNTDVAGQLTLTGGTATYTFVGTYVSAPICVAGDTTAANAVQASATTTVLTLTGTGTDVVNYICIGRN